MELGVLTTYKVNDKDYGSYILGKKINTIIAAAKRRGLNETIESSVMELEPMPDYSLLTDEEIINRLPEVLHSASFLSFIALNAKTMTVGEVLGDEGILHELTHLLANIKGCNKKSLTCIRDSLKKLQKRAIGSYEPV